MSAEPIIPVPSRVELMAADLPIVEVRGEPPHRVVYRFESEEHRRRFLVEEQRVLDRHDWYTL